jgi:ATP-dependent DNA helicase RecG
VTGARPRHGETTDPYRLQAAIFNNTEPPINTRTSVARLDEGLVVAVEVDRYPQVCATKSGVCVRQVMGTRGPECQPYPPSQHPSRYVDLGLLDYSAQVVQPAAWDDLDPLEIERLPRLVRSLGTDSALRQLDDSDLTKALGLTVSQGDGLLPTVAGLLLIGCENAKKARDSDGRRVSSGRLLPVALRMIAGADGQDQ